MGPPVGRVGCLKCPLRTRMTDITEVTGMYARSKFPVTQVPS
jgi:hypothetical protein